MITDAKNAAGPPLSLPKIFAACVASVFLLIQLVVILPTSYRGLWYWPFVDYRMYSASWHRGDVIEIYEFRVLPCDRSLQSETLNTRELGITALKFQKIVETLKQHGADNQVRETWELNRDEAQAMIAGLIEERFPGRYCEGQIWFQSYTVGVDNPLDPNLGWNLSEIWPLGSESR